MTTSQKYIQKVREELGKKQGKVTDKKIYEMTGISRAAFGRYSKGDNEFDDYAMIKIAEILGIEALEIKAEIIKNSKEKPEVKQYWSALSAKIDKGANCILCSIQNYIKARKKQSYIMA